MTLSLVAMSLLGLADPRFHVGVNCGPLITAACPRLPGARVTCPMGLADFATHR